MQEEMISELEELNQKITPVLTEALEDVDIKTAIIYFAGFTKNFLEILDDENFRKVILQYIQSGD